MGHRDRGARARSRHSRAHDVHALHHPRARRRQGERQGDASIAIAPRRRQGRRARARRVEPSRSHESHRGASERDDAIARAMRAPARDARRAGRRGTTRDDARNYCRANRRARARRDARATRRGRDARDIIQRDTDDRAACGFIERRARRRSRCPSRRSRRTVTRRTFSAACRTRPVRARARREARARRARGASDRIDPRYDSRVIRDRWVVMSCG